MALADARLGAILVLVVGLSLTLAASAALAVWYAVDAWLVWLRRPVYVRPGEFSQKENRKLW